MNENVSLVISRQILSELCTQLPKLPDPVSKEVSHFTLEKVQPRVISFEEQVIFGFVHMLISWNCVSNVSVFAQQVIVSFQVASIRQHLGCIYEREGAWREAANTLVGIPLETAQK